jgi:hypothetical protein
MPCGSPSSHRRFRSASTELLPPAARWRRSASLASPFRRSSSAPQLHSVASPSGLYSFSRDLQSSERWSPDSHAIGFRGPGRLTCSMHFVRLRVHPRQTARLLGWTATATVMRVIAATAIAVARRSLVARGGADHHGRPRSGGRDPADPGEYRDHERCGCVCTPVERRLADNRGRSRACVPRGRDGGGAFVWDRRSASPGPLSIVWRPPPGAPRRRRRVRAARRGRCRGLGRPRAGLTHRSTWDASPLE